MKGIRLGQPLQRRRRHACPPPHILDRGIGAPRRDRLGLPIVQPAHEPQTKAERQPVPCPALSFQMAVPAALIDADGAHRHAMVARIADDLGRRVETHGLGVEQRAAEYLRVMMLHPAGGIGDLGEARRMALRKAV